MILEEADPRFCHQEEEPHLPNLSQALVAQGGFLCLLQATEVVPQSLRGTESLLRGQTWAQSLTAFPLQYLTRQDPFNQACTAAGLQQCLGPPGSPALGQPRPLSLETEGLLLEEAPYARHPPAPPRSSATGLPCPLHPAGPWMTNRLLHLLQWATGPPSTGRWPQPLLLRTASPRCLLPQGLPPPHRPHLRHHRPAGLALLPCLQVPVAVMKSQDSHSGTCPSLWLHPLSLRQDVQALFLPRPVRDPLLQ